MQLCKLLCCIAALLVAAFAQVPTGTISGVVLDESGAVVANAQVTITHKDSGATRSITSSADGVFSAAALAAGEYEVKAIVAGFRTTVREATVETGATTTVDMRLQVGASKD